MPRTMLLITSALFALAASEHGDKHVYVAGNASCGDESDGVELLHVDESETLSAVTHFRVFEEKRLVTSASNRGTEQREGLIADVTGEGRADLVLLCHDHVLVYPQDSGE